VRAVPEQPKLYHITHVDFLPAILQDGCLYSEASLKASSKAPPEVGMSHIKERRFHIDLSCHPGTVVADYVPFYFCPRSVMLYLLYKRNHLELTYRGGQEPIVHLEFDCAEVMDWADAHGHPWAIAPTSAGAFYTQFYADREALKRIDWGAVAATDWRDPEVKEHKQAEFLLHGMAPWSLVRRIGVYDQTIQDKVIAILSQTQLPLVESHREWYY
jgi:hypothetical protein